MTKEKEKVEVIEEVKDPKYWQWIKSEKIGTVVTIKDEDSEWINFNEGGRLAKDLREEFLKPLEDDLAQEFIKTQPQTINPLDVSAPKNITTPVPNTESPIRILLNKQKKLDKVPMGLSFSVKIPKKNIYEVLESSFDPTELNEELENFIEDQINKEEILQTLKDSIKILIQERYK